jgi:hypothetical protein
MKTWTVSNIDNVKHLGTIEFQSNDEEYHVFELMQTSDRIVFGGFTNNGFLESGYMEIDDCFSIDENLQELLADLETYYNDGPQYVSMIVCNERM